MNIDWSKAPPHATHWCPGNARIEAGWIYKAGHEFYSCYAEKSCEHIPNFPAWRALRLVPRPLEIAPWTGEGLPPVGAVCEIRAHKLNEWHEAKIAFSSRNVVVWDWAGEPSINGLCTAYAHAIEIRPIRTPEQAAMEERDQASFELAGILAGHDQHITVRDIALAKYLYDIGYRKQVQP